MIKAEIDKTKGILHARPSGPLEAADFDPPVLAAAVRVGSTRLIDNVPLEGEER